MVLTEDVVCTPSSLEQGYQAEADGLTLKAALGCAQEADSSRLHRLAFRVGPRSCPLQKQQRLKFALAPGRQYRCWVSPAVASPAVEMRWSTGQPEEGWSGRGLRDEGHLAAQSLDGCPSLGHSLAEPRESGYVRRRPRWESPEQAVCSGCPQ